MPSIKKESQFIKTFCVSLAAIAALAVVCTPKKVLAGADTLARQMTRIEWERGKVMKCNGRGIEHFSIASNVNFHSARVWVGCLTQNNQADWIIIGGISAVFNENGREGVFLERSMPTTDGSENKPNLYSFARFTIGYNCRLDSTLWQCQHYSPPIEKNLLRTFGSDRLRSSNNNSVAFDFKDLEAVGHYHTTNRR